MFFNHSLIYTNLSADGINLDSDMFMDICVLKSTANNKKVKGGNRKDSAPQRPVNVFGFGPKSDFAAYFNKIYITRTNSIRLSFFFQNTTSTQPSVIFMPDHQIEQYDVFKKDLTLDFWGFDNAKLKISKNIYITQKAVLCFTTRYSNYFLLQNSQRIKNIIMEQLCGNQVCPYNEAQIKNSDIHLNLSFLDNE